MAVLAGAMAWLLLCGTALAATVTIDTSGQNVYANGNAVTVSAGSGAGTTVVTSDDGTTAYQDTLGGAITGTPNVNGYNIYGGSLNATVASTDVTIAGGTVNNVYGGGHDTTNNGTNANVTGDTSVAITGGTVNGDVYGGGSAQGQDGAGSSAQVAQANVGGTASVDISGGKVNGEVYGGGLAQGGDAANKKDGGDAIADTNKVSIDISANAVKDTPNHVEVYAGGQAIGGDGSKTPGGRCGGSTYNSGGDATANVAKGADIDLASGVKLDGRDISSKGVEKDGKSNGGKAGDATAKVKGCVGIDRYCFGTVTTVFKNGNNVLSSVAEQVKIPECGIVKVSPAAPNFTGSANYTFGSPSPAAPYTLSKCRTSVTFVINCTPKTDDVVVTFIYQFKGTQVGPSDVQTAHPVFGGSGVTLTSSRATDGQYKAASGSKTVSFGDPDQTVYIDLVGQTRTINVVFRFYYGTTLLQSNTVPTEVTYGGSDVTVPAPEFNVAGYYLSGPVAPVTVNFNTAAEQSIIYVDTQVLARVYPPAPTPIPLNPGTQTSPIPLSPGLPATGDASSFSFLLVGLGLAVLAVISEAVRKKHEE